MTKLLILYPSSYMELIFPSTKLLQSQKNVHICSKWHLMEGKLFINYYYQQSTKVSKDEPSSFPIWHHKLSSEEKKYSSSAHSISWIPRLLAVSTLSGSQRKRIDPCCFPIAHSQVLHGHEWIFKISRVI